MSRVTGWSLEGSIASQSKCSSLSHLPDCPLPTAATTREAATAAEPAPYHEGGGDQHESEAADATQSVQKLERAALVPSHAYELIGAIPFRRKR